VLAQHILNQRSEVETFFMDSLGYVKEQAEIERVEAAKATANHNNIIRRNVMTY
jgi:hypothetical protein